MTDFRPIELSSPWDRPNSIRVLEETDVHDITRLLLGHKVTKVAEDHLLLDNGTVIRAVGNDGGCSCGAGDYPLSILNGVDNIITRVEFDYRPAGENGNLGRSGHPDDPEDDEWTGYYRIFVYADNEQVNLMQFDGTDGSGYYGTGFELLVRDVTP